MLILAGTSSKNTGAECAKEGKRCSVRYDSVNAMAKVAAVGPLAAA
jgi:hypothetical protein